MPIRITIAKSPEQIDEVFKIRHKVFCEEEEKFQNTPDGRIIDRFDAYPTTNNLIVLNEEQAIGSIRLTLDSTLGVPSDEFFDFRAHLPTDYRLISCSMFCISKPFRSRQLAFSLILMAAYFAISNNATHATAPINPAIARLLTRGGFKIVGEELVDPHTGLNIIPVMLIIKELNDFFVNFVKQNQIMNFLSCYDCTFYSPGEYIIKEGEQGDSAFVIVEGEVEVKLAKKVIATLSEGEVFGELALLTDEVRTADVIAKTDLRVMTMAKTVFMDYLLNHPEKAVTFMKSMGSRMKKLITGV